MTQSVSESSVNSLRLRGIVIATGSCPGFRSRIAGGDLTPRSAASGTSLCDAEYHLHRILLVDHRRQLGGDLGEGLEHRARADGLGKGRRASRSPCHLVRLTFVDIRWTGRATWLDADRRLDELDVPFASRGPSLSILPFLNILMVG